MNNKTVQSGIAKLQPKYKARNISYSSLKFLLA